MLRHALVLPYHLPHAQVPVSHPLRPLMYFALRRLVLQRGGQPAQR
jgi:hypothetical protein